MVNKKHFIFVGIIIFVVGIIFGYFWQQNVDNRAHEAENSENREKSAMVMPYDLDQTKHIFHELPSGGMLHLYTSATNTKQIALIQMRLKVEYDRFRTGNFSDQIKLYGADIPGPEGMSENYSQIQFVYTDLPNGAQIQLIASDPKVIRAIHAWIRVQLVEHGADAESYM